jgi:inner membrane protein
MAANAPDIDVLAYAQGSYASLAFRRGVTHGPVALLLLPLAVAVIVLAYDRLWRRRRRPAAPAARGGALVVLAFIGTLTHAPLDWLNTYGVRMLMPFTDRWLYGDSLFIIDPWVWLVLAAPLVGVYSATRRARIFWALLAVLGSGLVLGAPQVPLAARVVWVTAVAAVVIGAARAAPLASRRERPARIALAAVGAYIGLMIAADSAASRHTRSAAERAGIAPISVMVAPVPANPLSGDIVVEARDAYHLGRFEWLGSPRVSWAANSISKGERNAVVLATLQLPEVRDFLRWSRFPFVEVRQDGDRQIVRFGDARYPDRMRGGLSGITVEVERGLRPTTEQ